MKIVNKKARFNYKLLERFEVGIVLIGGEVKSIKRNHVDLNQSYAKIIDGEIYLINANIPVEGKKDYLSTRTRKLLLHKKEIVSIQTKMKTKNLVLIPTKMYSKKRLIKVELALAKSKRKFDKKNVQKQRDIERDVERELREEKQRHTDLNRV